MVNSFNEFAEDTGVQPADTSRLDQDQERWYNSSGVLDAGMYWRATVAYLAQWRALP